jgi:hypothetical protein
MGAIIVIAGVGNDDDTVEQKMKGIMKRKKRGASMYRRKIRSSYVMTRARVHYIEFHNLALEEGIYGI